MGEPPADRQGQADRDRGEGVGEIMDGVSEQADGAAGGEYRELDSGGDEETAETDGQGPCPFLAEGQLGVERLGRVVAVVTGQVV